MRDLRGVEIQEGDLVSFIWRMTRSGELSHGTVVGLTEKLVEVAYHKYGNDRTSKFMPHNVCVIQQSKETEMKEL